MRKINRIVVHCSATGPHMDVGADFINRVHLERGFVATSKSPATGYHKVIKRDGTVEDGRPEWREGAHAKGHNADSLAVCLIGGVKEDNKTPENNFTAEQFESLKTVLADWWERYGKVETLGHRDLPGVAKACPCFDVADWLETEGL